jgi:uncharacterized membrane protein YeaQ/YmgE (transglycosylase-associated protein family)
MHERGTAMHGFIWWILVGLIAGWLTGKIMSGGGYGAIMDIIIGIIGAFLGFWRTFGEVRMCSGELFAAFDS